jgi:hypothetical protein
MAVTGNLNRLIAPPLGAEAVHRHQAGWLINQSFRR